MFSRFIPILRRATDAILPSQPVVPVRQVGEFSQLSASVELSGLVVLGNPGGVSDGLHHPVGLGEHQTNHDDDTVSLSGGNTDIGMVFKSSKLVSRLDRVVIGVAVEPAGAGLFDEDFESYADTAALRVAWVPSDVSNSPNDLETGVVFEGTKSQRLTIKVGGAGSSDTWTHTFSVEDWSDIADLRFALRLDQDAATNVLRFRIGDGVNTASVVVPQSDADVWDEKAIPIESFVQDGGSPPSLAAITTIEIEVESNGTNGFAYVDLMDVVGAAGTITAELRAAAPDQQLPTAFGALLATDTVELPVSSDGRVAFDFGGVVVEPGQYLILALTAREKPGTIVKIRGTLTDTYSNGQVWTSADDGASLTHVPGQDAAFATFYWVDGAVQMLSGRFDGDPGQEATLGAFIQDNDNVTIAHTQVFQHKAQSQIDYNFAGLGRATITQGQHVIFNVAQDALGVATEFSFSYQFFHEPIERWG